MSDESLLTFPCEFQVKVTRKNHHGFYQAVVEKLKKHLDDYETTEIEKAESKKKNYNSSTAKVNAISQQHLGVIYMDLTANDWVITAL